MAEWTIMLPIAFIVSSLAGITAFFIAFHIAQMRSGSDIKVMRLHEGDTVVVRTDAVISTEDASRIKALFGGHPLVVIDRDVDIEILRGTAERT